MTETQTGNLMRPDREDHPTKSDRTGVRSTRTHRTPGTQRGRERSTHRDLTSSGPVSNVEQALREAGRESGRPKGYQLLEIDRVWCAFLSNPPLARKM